MLGYLFLILTLIVLERFRQGKHASVWLLPLLMLIWANTHGSWIVGLGTIGVYLASGLFKIRIGSMETSVWSAAERRHLCIALLLSVFAVFVTPYGAGIARVPFEVNSSLPVSFSNIQEWMPMVFNLAGRETFSWFDIGISAGAGSCCGQSGGWKSWGFFFSLHLMAFLHERFLRYLWFFSRRFWWRSLRDGYRSTNAIRKFTS